ncbi:MAG: Stk1 family PASTA domain-containing Ser/Thr kinase [Oscillospiraceae bacterium]|nr:Stk1 family PASTA domain-containing Ser/Thr kinase [Oscillospiraceae bacterium]
MDKDKYIGRLLDGRYEILEVLGVGGMAVVYKARCHRLNRLVAIKILKDEFSKDEEFRRRFQAESQAVAMLSHPNIVSVYDVSTSEDGDHIVMELIDGISLKQYMEKKGVLNWKETLHFAMQIAKALEHAHSRGLVHRDIKPHNVMVLKNGSVKVTDFGIAQVTTKSSTVTKEALGSVHYISPEQAKGGRVDNRSDLYSLGIVMYEMIAGRVPYDGDTPVSVAIQHINGGAQKPSTFNPNTPLALEQIIMKALQLAPKDRYPNATAMLYDMDEFRKDPTKVFPEAAGDGEAEGRPVTTDRKTGVVPSATRTIAQRTAMERTGKVRTTPRRDEEERGRGATVAIVTCAVVGVIAIIIFFVILAQGGLFGGKDRIQVPDLRGMDYDSLGQIDGIVVVRQSSEHDPSYAKGQIISQEPAPGDWVVSGTKVFVTVSLGGEVPVKTMEDLTGYTADDAALFLRGLDMELDVKRYSVNSDTVEAGKVVSTEPAQGQTITKGQTVELYVSIGPAVVTKRVPNVVGQNVEAALRSFELVGFKNVVPKEVESDLPKGTVVEQSAKENTLVDVSRKIILSVSMGPAEPDPTEPTEPQEVTVVYHFPLPEHTEPILLSILSGDEWIVEDEEVPAGDNSYKVTLTGTGSREYHIYVDGEYIDTVTVEFV